MKVPIQYKSAPEALSIIQSGNRVFVQGSAQTPTFLLSELAKMGDRFKDVELVFISVYGDMHVNKPELLNSFRLNSLFLSASIRSDVNEGRVDYVPVFLSEIPNLFCQHILPLRSN
jgi:acyl-CoA hydrolase